MTPAQITIVERTLASIDIDELASAFYGRAFAADPTLTAMFTSDPDVQRSRFAAELAEIVRLIRSHDRFTDEVKSLGRSHCGYGVRAAHYRLMGDVLLMSLATALGDAWTDEVAEAWRMAYNLTAETMMQGALEAPPTS